LTVGLTDNSVFTQNTGVNVQSEHHTQVRQRLQI